MNESSCESHPATNFIFCRLKTWISMWFDAGHPKQSNPSTICPTWLLISVSKQFCEWLAKSCCFEHDWKNGKCWLGIKKGRQKRTFCSFSRTKGIRVRKFRLNICKTWPVTWSHESVFTEWMSQQRCWCYFLCVQHHLTWIEPFCCLLQDLICSANIWHCCWNTNFVTLFTKLLNYLNFTWLLEVKE
jgi:hypothetical protein